MALAEQKKELKETGEVDIATLTKELENLEKWVKGLTDTKVEKEAAELCKKQKISV